MSQSDTIEVVVEIPKGSRNKYEMDHETHRIRLDRVLHSSVHYPTDYGFIPNTLAEDGDPLDALVVVEEGTFPGCTVPARPIGLLHMADEHGTDIKVLCVAATDPRFDPIRDLGDLAPHWLREIEVFFETYKQLEDLKEVSVGGWQGATAAWDAIAECQARLLHHHAS
ncbi:MAG TPA: inorganic diphosphatase [Candidatus Dormibacteraeota bacterium]|nr:inorganic diphosphatase [Candidatus Dormibacteraeota bacterium]